MSIKKKIYKKIILLYRVLKWNNLINLYLILEVFFLFLLIYRNNNYSDIDLEKEKKYATQRLDILYELCNNGILLNKKNFKKSINPKISIITPIYNKEKYIFRYLRSIQNQIFEDIEIILIDDCSTDFSIELIEKLKKNDERILLMKNKKNKGTLQSRNEGVLKSKGKYLFFLDPDDIISFNILNLCYSLTEKYNYDIIRFNIYEGNNKINLDFIVNKIINKAIFQPQLSFFLFYGLGKLEELDYYITNKLIKKELFIKTLNAIDKYYLNNYMIDCEDGLINFILYRIADSYYFIKDLGYYYIINKESITMANKFNFKKRLKSNFLYLKFIFQNTKNNIIEKNIANYIFLEIYSIHKNELINLFKEINEIEFYKGVINLYLQSRFISAQIKEILNNIMLFIIK